MPNLITMFFLGVFVAAILGLIMALPVMLLWDWVVPALFGLPEITFLQAWGLYILCVILFQSKVSQNNG